jgi:hypothetical protein
MSTYQLTSFSRALNGNGDVVGLRLFGRQPNGGAVCELGIVCDTSEIQTEVGDEGELDYVELDGDRVDLLDGFREALVATVGAL